jgi:hypothetical protein
MPHHKAMNLTVACGARRLLIGRYIASDLVEVLVLTEDPNRLKQSS